MTNEEFDVYIHRREVTEPEFRLEFVDGRFTIGGTLDGSAWLVLALTEGWGLEAAVALSPLDTWRQAIRVAYGGPAGDEDWSSRAERFTGPVRQLPDLGSEHMGAHSHCRRRLQDDLYHAVAISGLGQMFSRDFVMRLGEDAFTPDIHLLRGEKMERLHNYFVDGPSDLVIEILLPERQSLDLEYRFNHYQRGGVPHYWVIDPVQQALKLFRLENGLYRLQELDPDGRYRGVRDLTFIPANLWVDDRDAPRTFEAEYSKRDWKKSYDRNEFPSWDSIPFPREIPLQSQPITFSEFISWCPEAKLEGDGKKLIICGYRATKYVLGMALLSLGLVEVAKLIHPRELVRAIAAAEQRYQTDANRREQWWQTARDMAEYLRREHGIGGVGVTGDLLREEPLDYWSELSLVIWEAPARFDYSRCYTDRKDTMPADMVHFCDINNLDDVDPAERAEIVKTMVTLPGSMERPS